MADYTISETYTLPSRGLIYDTPIDPVIKLRSMTTREEMKRLARTDTPYKVMCEIIEDCIVGEKPAIRVYDMCLGDYQYLLHKLRVVTYGPDYRMKVACPNCGQLFDAVINLDDLEVMEYTDDIEELKKVTLPVSKKEITLRIQTPRILDSISAKTKDMKKKQKDASSEELGLLATLEYIIGKVDGEVLNPAKMETFIKGMPMRDVNVLIQAAGKLNGKVGIDSSVICTCTECNYDVASSFRITSEFFGPTID